MAYTFNEQLDLLSSLVGDSNTDESSQWPLAQRKTEINMGEKQFAKDTKMLMENATSTIASMAITLPTGWLETFALYVTISGTKYKITNKREISPKDLERYADSGDSIPYYYMWTYAGVRTIKFLGSSTAINGATYDLYYFTYPTTDMSATTETSSFPEEYRQASVYKAASNLLLQVGQYTRAQQLLSMYDRLVIQGKREAGTWYSDYENPVPDFNFADDGSTDRQGGGWPQ